MGVDATRAGPGAAVRGEDATRGAAVARGVALVPDEAVADERPDAALRLPSAASAAPDSARLAVIATAVEEIVNLMGRLLTGVQSNGPAIAKRAKIRGKDRVELVRRQAVPTTGQLPSRFLDTRF